MLTAEQIKTAVINNLTTGQRVPVSGVRLVNGQVIIDYRPVVVK
jgi:hypothetical protein